VIAEDNTAVVSFFSQLSIFVVVIICLYVVLMLSNVFPIFRVGRTAAVGDR
jgi:hypothetical protein